MRVQGHALTKRFEPDVFAWVYHCKCGWDDYDVPGEKNLTRAEIEHFYRLYLLDVARHAQDANHAE